MNEANADDQDSASAHYANSVLREVILEHLFVGEVMRRLWVRGVTDAEILHSEFDAGGYDVVLSHRSVTRHIQLKSKLETAKSASVSVSLNLASKPSGCVIWMLVDANLNLKRFLWFGDRPGKPLPTLTAFKVAKHVRADATGHKSERPNHRVVPASAFTRLNTYDEVIEHLLDLDYAS